MHIMKCANYRILQCAVVKKNRPDYRDCTAHLEQHESSPFSAQASVHCNFRYFVVPFTFFQRNSTKIVTKIIYDASVLKHRKETLLTCPLTCSPE